MTVSRLKRLNRILGDRMGFVPFGKWNGQPRFQWKESKDLLFLVRTGTKTRELTSPAGLIVIEEDPICEWQRQRTEDGWCLAKWIDPPSPEEWKQQYGSVLGYPKDGYWFSIAPLRPGVEPDEQFCQFCADQIDWQKSLGFQQTLDLIMARYLERERKTKEEIGYMIDQCVQYHVPGKRGGPYSVPQTQFDR